MILILNEYMEKERDNYMENQSYDRDPNRHDFRNGYYERDFTLNIGKIKLKLPRTRSGNYSTEVIKKYSRFDHTLLLSMIEIVDTVFQPVRCQILLNNFVVKMYQNQWF